jgi:hypothetical protein
MAAHFICNDLSERGFSQTGRTVEQYVIEWLVTLLRGLNGDTKILDHCSLARVTVLLKRVRTEIGDE